MVAASIAEATGHMPRSAALHARTAASAEYEANIQQHPSGIIPTVTNVVATMSLGKKLELRGIAGSLCNNGTVSLEYRPQVRLRGALAYRVGET